MGDWIRKRTDITYWMAVIDQLPGGRGMMMNEDGAMMLVLGAPGSILMELVAPVRTGLLLPVAVDPLLGEWCINLYGWRPYD